MLANRVRMGLSLKKNYFRFENIFSWRGNPTDIKDGYYVADTDSFGGIGFDAMYFESGESYEISFEYYAVGNTGWYTIADVGTTNNNIVYGSDVSLNLITDGNLHTKIIIIKANRTKKHSITLMKNSGGGSVHYKAGSLFVKKIREGKHILDRMVNVWEGQTVYASPSYNVATNNIIRNWLESYGESWLGYSTDIKPFDSEGRKYVTVTSLTDGYSVTTYFMRG